MATSFKRENDIIVNDVNFKKAVKFLLEAIKSGRIDKSIGLAQLSTFVAQSIGYADLHQLTSESSRNEEKKDQVAEFREQHYKMREDELKHCKIGLRKKRLSDICPKKLLNNRSLVWLESVLTTLERQLAGVGLSGENPKCPNVTIVTGKKDNGLVLDAFSNFINCKIFVFKGNISEEMQRIREAIITEIEECNRYNQEKKERKRKGERIFWGRRNPAGCYLIKGITKELIDQGIIPRLVEISNLCYSIHLIINIENQDLVYFSSPEYEHPHFHYLRVYDLDVLKTNQSYLNPTYFWTKDSYRLDNFLNNS